MVSGARIAPSRDRRTEVREEVRTVRVQHQRWSSKAVTQVLVDPRRCLSQRIVVGRARALRGEEERRDGKGRSICENSLIQPRMVGVRRCRNARAWGSATPSRSQHPERSPAEIVRIPHRTITPMYRSPASASDPYEGSA
jgi:hypothetical protein